ncbi:MAG: hypothetical protein UY16_C0070G0009 [Candidatus Gottesmanbacteria bacterium GW2011_GWA2_47_9]|uniref:Uncharacterized protein n=1 Tax=Candidatus Gottesmanbacteria bacterium GW2011_GWA2_47_9 TaxID=1618445 RepID=A0A0G1WU97_9BACT|nr:MAG: hypothetical protein UY16_C0070G0009 [Candidatus Gottesmanbacteria bacterium GW2011_GWA2_47_9]
MKGKTDGDDGMTGFMVVMLLVVAAIVAGLVGIALDSPTVAPPPCRPQAGKLGAVVVD